MLFIKDILRKIEEKRGVTLTASEARVSPSLSNELHSEPFQKLNGPVPAAKKSTSWDEDWGPKSQGNTTASHSLMISKKPASALPATSVATIALKSSTPTLSQRPVDVEWPPRNSSSAFASQSNSSGGGPSDSTFSEIDPFANWPPRSNDSTNSQLGSSHKPDNTQQYSGSSAGNAESLFGLGAGSQASMASSTGNAADSLFGLGGSKSVGGQPIGKKTKLDIGSVFVSANSAPKLAPPPLTAIGRGRGRNQGNNTLRKPSSEEHHPILDLL